MSQLANQRIAWFNGKYVPEGQVLIPFRDRSWKYGDGAFDMTRTFDGRAFRLKEHIDRFYRSMKYLRIDPGMSPQEMIDISEEIVARNEHLRQAAGDWWIGQRVSRGVDAIGDEGWEDTGPQVVGAGLRHWRIAPRTFDTKPQRGQVASGAERSQRVMRRFPTRRGRCKRLRNRNHPIPFR